MAEQVKLQVSEGQRVIADGVILEEGGSFEVGEANADSLIERGLAERPKAATSKKTKAKADDS